MIGVEPFKKAVVRITDEGGRFTCGAGILVSTNRILTCAHVICAAAGITPDAASAPTAAVRVNLPFVGPDTFSARVLCSGGWHPGANGTGFDLAILEVDAAFARAGYSRFSSAINFDGKRFVAWGAPKGHEHNLIAIEGEFKQAIANGRYVVSVRGSTYKISAGCSGAPVVEPTTGLILGLIVQKELDPSADAGFVIPATQLLRVLRDAGAVAPSIEESGLERLRPWAEERYCHFLRGRAEVSRFIQNYSGRSGEPKAFVGRGLVLNLLDQWLDQRETRFRLLSGAAGGGKSAVLLHWLARRVQRPDELTIFYLPISIRFDTADETTGVRLLFAALSDVFGEIEESFPQQPEVEDYLDRIAMAWANIASHSDRRFLLVVDGLDEAINQWFIERRILPPELPDNLHVLISARYKPGHESGDSWLKDLASHVVDVRDSHDEHLLLEVAGLNREAIAAAMLQMGHPLGLLAERQAFVDALYRLTDNGDPLLLTLWLEQLWRQRGRAPSLDPETLVGLRPSFAGFYDFWMKEQQSLWKAADLAIHRHEFGQVMDVLAVARGPMLLSDLAAVLEGLKSPVPWNYTKLRAALESAHRLVVGDGETHGYALLHPRLAHYFQEQLEASKARLGTVQDAFRAWGANTVSRLNSGDLSPQECPRYLLFHYVPSHISVGNANSEAVLNEFYMPLMRRGWALAWQVHEDVWVGYLSDLQRVFQALHAFNRDCMQRRRPSELRLAAQVRCALMAATARSLTTSLPPELVVALARAGVWSVARAVRAAMLFKPVQRAECFVGLATVAKQNGEPVEAQSLLRQALHEAAEVQSEDYRAELLSTIAAKLGGDSALLERALRIAMEINDERCCARALSEVVAHLRGEAALLGKALKRAAEIEDGECRIEALTAVAAQSQGRCRRRALRQTLDALSTIDDARSRAVALSSLSAQLQGTDRERALRQALDAASKVRDAFQPETLSAVAAQLQGERRRQVFQQALRAVLAIEREDERLWALCAVAERLQEKDELLQEALTIAARMEDAEFRAQALSAVAARLQGDLRRQTLEQVLQAAMEADHDGSRAEVLIAVAPNLRGEAELLERALEIAVAVQSPDYRPQVLGAMAAQLQEECALLGQVHKAAAVICDQGSRAEALGVVATQLKGKHRERVVRQALRVLATIHDEFSRYRSLTALVAGLKGENTLLNQAFEVAETIVDEGTRAWALSGIVEQLEGGSPLLQKAWNVAAEFREPNSRAQVQSVVAAQLQGGRRHQALRQALDAVSEIREADSRAGELFRAVEHLREDSALLRRAWEVAMEIDESWLRARALAELATLLPGKARRPALHEALRAAAATQDAWHRALALKFVAANARGEFRYQVLKQALEAVATIHNGESLASAIDGLAPQLRGKRRLLEFALQIALTIQHEYFRVDAVSSLAMQMRAERTLLGRALRAVEAARDNGTRARALSKVGAQLRGKLRHHALKRALELATCEDIYRAELLSAVMPQLHGEDVLLQQALMAAESIRDARFRVTALNAVAAQSQGELREHALRQALNAAAAIEFEKSRAEALSALPELLAGYPDLQAKCNKAILALRGDYKERVSATAALARQNTHLLTYDMWFSWLHEARLTRPALLGVTGELTWAAVQLTNRRDEVQAIAAAIHELGEWWP